MENIPKHVAIIPDGNRRWAKARALSPWLGHNSGKENFKEASQTLFDAGVEFITFWAASVDNLTKRDKEEVKFLLQYFLETLRDPKLLAEFQNRKVKVKIIGEWAEVIENQEIKQAIENIQNATKENNNHTLAILFGYDGKTEMLKAINKLKDIATVTEQNLREALSTGYLPDVDLVIRTGGEPHWSAGFLMWLTANSQFYFTECLWPDFNKKQALIALEDYATRQRRLGA